MSDKYAWDKAARRDFGAKAAREGRAFYVGQHKKKKRKKKHKRKAQSDSRMPFGKFKGRAIASIPSWYLQWALREMTLVSAPIKEAMRKVVQERGQTPNEPNPNARPPEFKRKRSTLGAISSGWIAGSEYVEIDDDSVPWELTPDEAAEEMLDSRFAQLTRQPESK